jgi:3-phosphoshikimate 1-carboxyvinyltransferase
MPEYAPEILIAPWRGPPPRAVIQVPGSKSLTNRALVIAALATGRSVLTGALDSDDTRVMIAALRALGIGAHHESASCQIAIEGCGGNIPAQSAWLDVANSGTSLRFLTAFVATGHGAFHLDGTPRMRQRPVGDLLLALRALGCRARSDHDTGCPPVTVESDGLRGGHASIKGDISSQFLSGLLMALPNALAPCTIEVCGPLVSQPYVAMTLAVMEDFGITIARHDFHRFEITPARYRSRAYTIEPDASAASYFFALAAITGGEIIVSGLGTTSLQGDLAFADALEQMGCSVLRDAASTTLRAGPLHAIDIDMNAISDTVMTLAVVALFAEGATRIRNVAHIRHKESDRIAALATELRKLGARVEEHADGLLIDPPPPEKWHGARIATYDDHRMAMSFALSGLRIPGVTILDPGCVAKTYPGFWDDLESVRNETHA